MYRAEKKKKYINKSVRFYIVYYVRLLYSNDTRVKNLNHKINKNEPCPSSSYYFFIIIFHIKITLYTLRL